MMTRHSHNNLRTRLTQALLISFMMSACFSVNAAIISTPHADPLAQKAGFLTAKRQTASNSGEAAKIAKAKHGGKVVKVSTITSDRGVTYKVKLLLKDGRVKTVTIKGQ